MKLTRRQLLAGVGLGTVGVGGFGFGRSAPPYTHYTYAATGDVEDRRLRVAWYERYNGALVETQGGSTANATAAIDPDSDPAYVEDVRLVTDATGPVLSIGNVLPRDAGVLVVGLEVADDLDIVPEPIDVWLQTTVTSAENGVNEPERTAGDSTAADGELADEIAVTLWRDDSPVGSCNGVRELDERLGGTVIDRASMRDAFDADSDAGSETGILAAESVFPGDRRCLALRWEFDDAFATNRSQGDGVSFDVTFVGVPVGSQSPFLSAGGGV